MKKVLSSTLNIMKKNTGFILLLIMIVFAAIISDNFFTWGNIVNLLRRVSINGIMASGFAIVMLSGGFDLSIGSTLSLTGIIALGFERFCGPAGSPAYSGNAVIGVILALCLGLIIGFINGSFMKITRGGMGEAFMVTLGTSLVVMSIGYVITKGSEWNGVRAGWFVALGKGELFGIIPIPTVIMFVVMILLQFLIKKTRFGRELIYTGGTKNAAFLSGISVGNIKIVSFMIAGFLAAVAGLINAARNSGAHPAVGQGEDFNAAIAAIVGGVSVTGGGGSMVQVLTGVLILGLITNILNLQGVASEVQFIIRGCILLIAILLDAMKRR